MLAFTDVRSRLREFAAGGVAWETEEDSLAGGKTLTRHRSIRAMFAVHRVRCWNHVYGVRLGNGDTAIVLDEVKSCPRSRYVLNIYLL